jgi:hypothetical protein
MDSRARHFVVFWFSTFFFLVCYFLKFDEFIFSLQDTYNSRLNERYEDDPSTSLDLDRNRVYGLCNIMAENLWIARSVSTVGCSQLILSTQTLKFTTMLEQWVQGQTTHLNEKYKCFTSDYKELCRMVMEMRSQMGRTCAPPNWLYGSGDD